MQDRREGRNARRAASLKEEDSLGGNMPQCPENELIKCGEESKSRKGFDEIA